MAWSWDSAIVNELCDALVAHLSGGKGTWYTSAPASIDTFTFTGAFGAASSGVATHSSMTVATNSSGSSKTIASLRVYESDGTTEVGRAVAGTIGSGEGVELSSLALADGDTVQLTSFSVTVGPMT